MAQKKKFKLTNELMEELGKRASALPPVIRTNPDGTPRMRDVTVPGSKLTQADMAPGQPLRPELFYKTREFIHVDHFKTIVDLYKENGMDGVNDYEQATLALKKFTLDSIKKPWYVSLVESISKLDLLWLKIIKAKKRS